MSYVTNATKWLSEAIGQNTKDLIAKFYELADSHQTDSGHLMATQVFTKDASLVATNGIYKGSAGISIPAR